MRAASQYSIFLRTGTFFCCFILTSDPSLQINLDDDKGESRQNKNSNPFDSAVYEPDQSCYGGSNKIDGQMYSVLKDVPPLVRRKGWFRKWIYTHLWILQLKGERKFEG